jgi:phosphatidylethanolamine-binding protein (PEBP) family uncharacterized protein
MEQRKGARSLIALTAAAAALVVAGCGGSSPNAGSASTAATSSSATATTSAQSSLHPAGSTAPAVHHLAKSRAHLSLPTGPPAPGITPAQRAKAALVNIALSSPAVQHLTGVTGQLPAKYTCDGQNTPPPLRWQGVPSEAQELQLFVMSLKPVAGKLFFDWAVAGLSPKLTSLEPGHLPAGAVVGSNSDGHTAYSICPSGTEHEQYVFALFALPKRLGPKQGFDPLTLRDQVIHSAHKAGLLILSYQRGAA